VTFSKRKDDQTIMILPVQATFRNIDASAAVAARVQEEANKLDKYFDRITSCRVIVEAPHRHHRRGERFSFVRIQTFSTSPSPARAPHIVGNREWALDCRVPFIEKLASRTLPDDGTKPQRQREPYQSPWEKVLAEALRQAGITVVPQYPIAGRFLDLAILSAKN
jgi:hypothetical protein